MIETGKYIEDELSGYFWTCVCCTVFNLYIKSVEYNVRRYIAESINNKLWIQVNT